MINWLMPVILVLWWWLPRIDTSTSFHPGDTSYGGFACELVVDAGPDTNVCSPGGLVQLMGDITGNAIFIQWSPPQGLSNPMVLNPTANITGPITYTLSAFGIDPANPNLIINGDFEMGNTGFVSQYIYVDDIPGYQMEMYPEGTYTVIHNPNLVHNGFSPCTDHTSGGGNMMVINGAANLQDIWCQIVPIEPNTYYNVSAWVASVNPSSPAILRFSVNGIPLGNVVNAPSTPCQWVSFNAFWFSGSTTTAEICILNLNTALGGNDFAIDDIFMSALCLVQDDVEITLVDEDAPTPVITGPDFLCDGQTGTYNATFPPGPPVLTYAWTVTMGGVILAGQGTPEVIVQWSNPPSGQLCLDITTRCDEDEACLDITIGTEPIFPTINGTTSLCPGESTVLTTTDQGPGHVYFWEVPAHLQILSGQGTPEIDLLWQGAGEAEVCVEVTNACGYTFNCTFIQLYAEYLVLFDTTLCQGTTLYINGHEYGNGIFTGIEWFTTVHGCDSIVEISITEATVLTFLTTASLCPGDSVFAGGAYQYTEGIYVDSFTTVSLCDSVVITEIIITPFDTTWLLTITCDPDQADTLITTFSMGLCDSTVIHYILYAPPDTVLMLMYSCLPADTGTITQVLVNMAGCDSLVITTTQLLPSDTTLIFLTSCDPFAAGVALDTLVNTSGCDSLVVTTTTYVFSDTTLLTFSVCTYADTGSTTILLTNSMGCDSLVIENSVFAGSAPTYLETYTCRPEDAGVYIDSLTNQFGCDSIISTTIHLLNSDTTFLSTSTCVVLDTGITTQYLINEVGCDSVVILTTTLLPADDCRVEALISLVPPPCHADPAIVTIDIQTGRAPFTLQWINGPDSETVSISAKGIYILSLPKAGTYLLVLTSFTGIVWEEQITVVIPPALTLQVLAEGTLNEFEIGCHGDSTGSAFVDVLSTGTPPLDYHWSNGETQAQISGLPEGLYAVTVTDQNGCTVEDNITLQAPSEIQYMLELQPIQCYGQSNGTLTLTSVSGGVPPLTTAMNGGPFTSSLQYPGLGPAQYLLEIMDLNGCGSTETITFAEPAPWSVQLGPDTLMAYGSFLTLNAFITGFPQGDIQLNWSDGQCDGCLSRTIETLSDITYTVTVTDEKGCIATDQIILDVFINRDIYIPNVFSPNGDFINDYFTVSAASGLLEIESLTVWDRWGNLVFQAFHIPPGDPVYAWDGRMNGRLLNPGLYVYKAEVIFQDGRKDIRFGDVTLIR